MARTRKAASPPSAVTDASPARWEERSARRVVETGRNQILERSRRIVDAAYRLLEEEGLEGLTIRAVLVRTGLSRRAFYERFEGKDDLMLAVFEHTILLATRQLGEVLRALGDPLARLEQIITLITLGRGSAWGPDRPGGDLLGAAMSREHLRLAESRPRDLQAALAPLIALIACQLSDGMASGVVRRDDPQRLAMLIYNLVSTTVHTEWIARDAAAEPADRERLAADMWAFCRRAVIA